MSASRFDPYADEIRIALAAGSSAAKVAARYHAPASSLKSWLSVHPEYDGRSLRTGQEGAVLLHTPTGAVASGHADSPEQLMDALGLVPDEWIISNVRVGHWGETFHLRMDLKPRVVDFILPATQWDYTAPGPAEPDPDQPQLIVVCGDQHAPYHDPVLHEKFQRWLADVRPDRGISNGDTVDFPTISRHADNPAYSADPQSCIDSAANLLHDYVRANERTAWSLLLGNHDNRLRNEILLRAERIYGIRPGRLHDEAAQVPSLSLGQLLRCDQLGIELMAPDGDGDYEHAFIRLGDKLSVHHGWFTGNNASRKTYERLGHSALFGHTHAKDTFMTTTWDMDGRPETHRVDQVGCMCITRGGLGYSVNPPWQQGFCTVELYPDGTFNVEHATFVNDTLLWRGDKW